MPRIGAAVLRRLVANERMGARNSFELTDKSANQALPTISYKGKGPALISSIGPGPDIAKNPPMRGWFFVQYEW
jgi:hypothetical protein